MSIAFTCPHCQSAMNVDDRFAGTTGPCKHCGKHITIPGVVQPSFNPPPKTSSAGTVIAILAVLAIFGLVVAGLLVALLLPAVQAARQAARRNSSINNQKQIVIALLNYESAKGHFPPAYTVDEDGNRMHSWRVLILPYLEEQALYDAYDFDQPWDSSHNLSISESMTPAIYTSPSDPSGDGETSYLAVVDPNGIFKGSEHTTIDQVSDGVSRTVAVVESSGTGIHWAEPEDLSVDELGNLNGPSPSGVNVGFADGSVQHVPSVTPEMILMNDGR